LRYLVTGGAGFIGSHLSNLLVEEGHEVVVVDDMSTGKVDNLLSAGVRLVPINMANYEAMIVEAQHADWIIHLAATVGVKNTMDKTPQLINNNINNTDTMFRVAAMLDKPIFFASTSEAYGTSPEVPFKETTASVFGSPDVIRWSYGQSKAIGEALANFYQKDRGLRFVTGRIFNSVGPRQSGEYGMVLPRFVKAAVENKPLSVYGSGLQTRSFCHVLDTVRAIYMLTQSGRFGEAYNIGGSKEVSILSLADTVIRQTRSMSTVSMIDYDTAYGPGYEDTDRRVADTKKITNDTGWEPQYSLEQIINDIAKEYNAD
jgi:UDP-glucose 4-epimerase